MAKGFDIDHLAKLARLQLSAEEKTLYSNQLSQVLTYFETLARADLPPAANVAQVIEESALRADIPGQSLGAEAVTKIAPASRDGQISVPRVVDDES
jgi:aspartyl-tRNA(Asn)/glutamyl-tRNA(Gln) amidotransferase subunit C